MEWLLIIGNHYIIKSAVASAHLFQIALKIIHCIMFLDALLLGLPVWTIMLYLSEISCLSYVARHRRRHGYMLIFRGLADIFCSGFCRVLTYAIALLIIYLYAHQAEKSSIITTTFTTMKAKTSLTTQIVFVAEIVRFEVISTANLTFM